jgi:hypothetical protein
VGQSEPWFWHLPIRDLLQIAEPGHALVINLQPNDKKKLSLFELMDVWGHSHNGWTPMMFHLRALFIEEDTAKCSHEEFTRKSPELGDPIFTMTYLYDSSVKDGHLTGRWTPPRPGATNSVLLWPDTFQLFTSAAQKIFARESQS